MKIGTGSPIVLVFTVLGLEIAWVWTRFRNLVLEFGFRFSVD